MKRKLTRTLALLAAFCGLQAFATPVTIWDGDFDANNLSKTIDGVTYTLALNDHQIKTDANGKTYIEIASGKKLGATISRSPATPGTSDIGGMMVMRCSNLSYGSDVYGIPCMLDCTKTGGYRNIAGLNIADDTGLLKGNWADGFCNNYDNSSSTKAKVPFGDGKFNLALSYSSGGVYAFLATSSGVWAESYKSTGLKGGGTYCIDGFAVGGYYQTMGRSGDFVTNARTIAGMRIYAVAFDTAACTTVSGMNGFAFPSEGCPDWNHEPVVIWDGDFNVRSKGAYVLKPNGNAVAADGSSITINQTLGVQIANSGSNPFGNCASTVIVKFSGYANPASDAQLLLAETHSNPKYHGITAKPSGAGQAYWNTELWANGTIASGFTFDASTTHTLAMAWRRNQDSPSVGSDTDQGTKIYLDGTNKGNWSGLFGVYAPVSVVIGGPRSGETLATGVSAATGMKIEKIAVFSAKLSAEDIAKFRFPSDRKMLYRLALDSNGDKSADSTGTQSVTTSGSVDPVWETSTVKFGTGCLKVSNAMSYVIDNIETTKKEGWTFSFWFHPNGMASWKDVLAFTFGGKTDKFEKNGSDQLCMYGDAQVAPALSYTANAWNHIAVVSTSTGFDVYCNGVKVNSWTGDVSTGLTKVYIGTSGYNDARTSSALVDEVAVFNWSMTADELAKLKINQASMDLFTSPIYKNAVWGNIGNATEGGITASALADANKATQTSFTVNFGENTHIPQAEIGGTGRVRITKIRWAARPDATQNVPAGLVIAQGSLSTASTSFSTSATAATIYKNDGTSAGTRNTFDFTFPGNVVFDASQDLTFTFKDANGANYAAGCSLFSEEGARNPKLKWDATYTPILEISGDYDPTPMYGRTLSINFGSGYASVSGTYGLVPSSTWNNTNDGTSSGGTEFNVSDGSKVTVKWWSSGNYGYTTDITDNALKGYLDDGGCGDGTGGGPRIKIENVPFKYYDVIVYQATDTAPDYGGGPYGFNPPAVGPIGSSVVNTAYSYDGSVSAARDTTSLKYGTTRRPTAVVGQNVVYLQKGFSHSTLDIKGGSNTNKSRGGIAAIQIVEVFPRSYSATVDSTPAQWSTQQGLTQTAGPIWKNGQQNTIAIANDALDAATLNFNAFTEAGRLVFASGSGKDTTFAGWTNTKFGGYDFSGVNGAIGFDARGASITADANLMPIFRAGSGRKFIFTGSGSNGVTIDYGSDQINANPWIGNHLVFDGGTHNFKSKSGGSDQLFGANATEANPTFYVKNGATLNWYSKDPCGWSKNVTANKDGIIRVDGTSKVKLVSYDSDSETWYWTQQFYLEAGSELELAAGALRFKGGAYEDRSQFYMPASDNGTSRITGNKSFHMTTDGAAGVGVNVGAGSTLVLSAALSSSGDQPLAKFGAGTFKFAGTLSSFQGKFQAKAGTMLFETTSSPYSSAQASVDSGAQIVFGAVNNTFANVISGAGVVVKNGANTTTTLSGANTYTGGTTVEAGTLVVTTPNGAYTVNGGTLTPVNPNSSAITVNQNGTFSYAQDISAGGTFAKSTFAAVNGGTVNLQATMSKADVQSEVEIAVADVTGDDTADEFTVVIINADTSNPVECTKRIADGVLYAKPQGAQQTLTYTPTESGNFTWQVGSQIGEKHYRDYDNITFATATPTAFDTTVNVASKVAATTLTVGGNYTFTNATVVAETVRTTEGADAAFEGDVIADAVVVTNGTVMANNLVASSVVVTNATFGAKVVGPSMKYVRLSITATQTSGNAPAVAEFRLYRGSATKGYERVEWPVGTIVSDDHGYRVVKESAGYPATVGTGNEGQPGCLIDGVYGSSTATSIYGSGMIKNNKWWLSKDTTGPWVVTIEFPEPVATFSGCNFCLADTAARNPKTWTIDVSNDGQTWTRVNETAAATWGSQWAWAGEGENVPAFLNSGTTPTEVMVGDKSTVVADGLWTAALEVGGDVTFKGVAGKSLTLDAVSSSQFDAGAHLAFDLTDYAVTEAGKQYVVMGSTVGWPETSAITVTPAGKFNLFKDDDGYYVLVKSGNYWIGDQPDGVGTWDLSTTMAWGTDAATLEKSVWLNGGAAFFTRNGTVTIDADAAIAPTAVNVTSNNQIAVTFNGAVTKLANVPLNIGSTNVTVTFNSAGALTLGAITAVPDSTPTIATTGAGTLTLAANNQFAGGTLNVGSGATLDVTGKTITDVTITGAGTISGAPTVSSALTVGAGTTLSGVALSDNAVLTLDDGAVVSSITGAGYVKKIGSGATTIAAGVIPRQSQDAVALKGIEVTDGTLTLGNTALFFQGGNNRVTVPLTVTGGTLDMNGAYTWATDGSGWLTGKPVTLGGTAAATVTGGNFTFYGTISGDCIVYNGGDGANAPATFAANWHSSYSDSAYTRTVNVGRGNGVDYDLLISGTIGLTGGQFAGTTVKKTGAGTVKMMGAYNFPALAIDAGTWKMGAANAAASATAVGVNGTLDVNGNGATFVTLTSVGTITSTGSAGTLNIASLAIITGNVDNVTLVSQGGAITVTNAVVGTGVSFVVDLGNASVDSTPFTFEDGSALYGTITTRGGNGSLKYNATTHKIEFANKWLQDTMIWLPIGDSITEGEQYMGHPGEGTAETRGGYRYQLFSQLTNAGQVVRSVGYRTGHSGTVEDPATTPWAWHAAQYGGVIAHDNNGSHGGALFDVENTLQVAGYPDVITVLLGVNDLSFSGTATGVYDSMDAMVKKIAAMRPNSKILVSTLLPAGGSRGYIVTYNTLLRERSAANASPFNLPNVTLIDVNAKFGAYADEYFKSSDHLHPNEKGSIKVAKAFSGFVASAIADIVDANAKMVHVHNGGGTDVVVRFSKALADGATATLTIAGKDVNGNAAQFVFENGAVDTTDKRVMRFDIPQSTVLTGGVYTAALSAIDTTPLASGFVEIQGTGAAANIDAAYRAGFQRYQTVSFGNGTITDGIGSGDNWAGNGPSSDQVVKGDITGHFIKRVGYYVELKRPGEPSQFAWVSMNAFDGSIDKSGIPTKSSGAHKAKVTNLQVYANRANVTNTEIIEGVVDTTQTGVVEFTPWDWTATKQDGYPDDIYTSRFGWNDTLQTSAGTPKGCMQVFRYTGEATVDTYTKFAAETVFAVNNFNGATETDLGIGSFSTHRNNAGGDIGTYNSWDWTDFVSQTKYTKFAVNAYEVKKIEIWVEIDPDKVFTADVGANATWSGLTWTNAAGTEVQALPANAETILNVTDAASSLTIDSDVAQSMLTVINCGAGKSIVIATNGTNTASFNAIAVSDCLGDVTLGFNPGATPIEAGANTIVCGGGTGALTVGAQKTVTITNGVWSGTVMRDNASTIRYAGTAGTTTVPYVDGDSNTGLVIYAADFGDLGDDGLQFKNSLTRKFEDGFVMTGGRFVTGNQANHTQNFTMDGGSITVTGSAGPEASTASTLFAHWNSTVNFTMNGGTLTAENAAARLGWDGKVYFTLNDGTFRVKGIKSGSERTKDASFTMNGGTLELGDFGLQGVSDNCAYTFSGGTVRAYADTQISVAHASGLQVTGNVTLDVGTYTLTVPGKVSGSGNITATGTGTLILSGDASSYTGVLTVPAGMTVKADGSWLTGGKLAFADSTCNLVMYDKTSYDGRFTMTLANGSATPASVTVKSAADDGHDYGTVTVTGTAPDVTVSYTPWVNGKGALYAWEFNGSLASTGRTNSDMGKDHGPSYTGDNQRIYAYSQPYNGLSWPTEFTTAIACTLPTNANVCLVGWGQASPGGIALTSGDVSKNEVKMVYWQNNQPYTELATMTVPNAATCEHLYLFTKTADGVKVYLDGSLVVNYSGALSLGVGVQVGTVYQGVGNTGLRRLDTVYSGTGDCKAAVNMLRVYDSVLGPNAIAELKKEFPYTSPNGTYTRALTGTANTWNETGAWTKTKEGEEPSQVDVPAKDATVVLTATDAATIANNLAAPMAYEAINLSGAGTITIAAGGNVGKITSSGLQVGANAVVEYSAVDLSSTPIEIMTGKKLTIDASMIDVTKYFTTKVIPLTGLVTAADDEATQFEIVPPTAAAGSGRTVSVAKNDSTHFWEVTITVEQKPFVYTVTDAEPGVWTWGSQEVTAEQVAAQTSGEIQKAGAGTATLAPQAGMVYTVAAGTLKFSAAPTADCLVTNVAQGAIFDLNGLQPGSESVACGFVVTLNGGTLANSSASQGIVKSLTLVKSSTVDVASGNIWIQSGSGGYAGTTLALGAYTLAKTGTGEFGVVETTVSGTGTIDIQNGMLWVQENARFGTSTVKVGANGTFSVRAGKTATVANVNGDGGTLTVAGSITGFNLTGTLTFVAGGAYGTITNAANAVAKVGNRRDLTFAGAGTVDVTLTTQEEQTTGEITAFNLAEGATTVGRVYASNGNDITDKCTISGNKFIVNHVAKIGTVYYLTLNAAIDAANAATEAAGKAIVLLADCSLTAPQAGLLVGQGVSIDFAGFTVILDAEGEVDLHNATLVNADVHLKNGGICFIKGQVVSLHDADDITEEAHAIMFITMADYARGGLSTSVTHDGTVGTVVFDWYEQGKDHFLPASKDGSGNVYLPANPLTWNGQNGDSWTGDNKWYSTVAGVNYGVTWSGNMTNAVNIAGGRLVAIPSAAEVTPISISAPSGIAQISNNGTLASTALSGNFLLAGSGTFGMLTVRDNPVLYASEDVRGLQFAGGGRVVVTLSDAEYKAGEVIEVFAKADGASTTIVQVWHGSDNVSGNVSINGGTITVKKEAKIGTTFYITLADAVDKADTGAEIELLADVNITTAIPVNGKALTLEGNDRILSGEGFACSNAGTVTIASGCVGIAPGADGVSIVGGRFTANTEWMAPTGYTMADLAVEVRLDYVKQLMVSALAPTTGQQVFPVKDAAGKDAGSVALSSTWVAEKTGKSTASEQVTELNKLQKNNLTLWENKVLQLKDEAGSIPVIAPQQTTSTTDITFKLAGVEVDTGSGAKVSYRVWSGSTPGAKEGTPSEAVAHDSTKGVSIALPESGVRYYTLETIIATSK